MEDHQMGGSNYSFSAKRIDDLGASEYTLAFIAVDVTGSLQGQEANLEKMLKLCVAACRRNPRADNMMLRVVLFSSQFHGYLEEIHGFRPLPEIKEDDYTGVIDCRGGTPLYEAAYTNLTALQQFAKDLSDNDFFVNGIGFVLTDGEDNMSKVTRTMVKDSIGDLVKSEDLESFRPILIGFGQSTWLRKFQNEAGFDQFVDAGSASESTLAKVADFVSQSLSSASQSLGTGGPSVALTF